MLCKKWSSICDQVIQIKYQENISDITLIESSREEEDDEPIKDDGPPRDDPATNDDDPATEEELPRSIITGAPLFAQNTRSKWR